jgi:tRNA G18 (ribose-2'-O)-methylase SpoU
LVHGAVGVADQIKKRAEGGGDVEVVVEGIEKPGNLGAILRTADAAGLAGVIACDARTDPANPAAIRASLGTVVAVPLAVATTAETIAWCHHHNRHVIAALPQATTPWHAVPLTGPTALVLGSEAHGLSPAWQEAAAAGTIRFDAVTLPMRGIADSLNVSATESPLTSIRASQPAAPSSTRQAPGSGDTSAMRPQAAACPISAPSCRGSSARRVAASSTSASTLA